MIIVLPSVNSAVGIVLITLPSLSSMFTDPLFTTSSVMFVTVTSIVTLPAVLLSIETLAFVGILLTATFESVLLARYKSFST